MYRPIYITKMKCSYNLVEFFSGIGSQYRALSNIGITCNAMATCEWDIHAFLAYDRIHRKESDHDILPEYESMRKDELLSRLMGYSLSNNGKMPMDSKILHGYPEDILRTILSSIDRCHNLIDITHVAADEMADNIDILTYSFPCQDLSNVGAFHGYNKGIDKGSNSRSSLLWEVGRILSEMKEAGKSMPRYLIMENVPTLLSDRHKHNFMEWIRTLDGLGYCSKYFPVNARYYGLPQNRPRLLMMSIFVGDDTRLKSRAEKYYDSLGNNEDEIIMAYKKSNYFNALKISDILKTDYSVEKYRNEAIECTPNDTPSRRRIWDGNPKYVLEGGVTSNTEEFVRTITTKQDRHPNSGNLYFDSGIEGRSKFRYLTPRECLLFMGFTEKDYEALISDNPLTNGRSHLFSRDKIIRLAGNSIPVKMLEGFFYQLYRTEEEIFGY